MVLLKWRNPSVSDEQPLKVPDATFIASRQVLIPFYNSLGDVGNILTSVRLSGEVELAKR